jgi:hypothetical protein
MEQSNQDYLEQVKEFGRENKTKLVVGGVALVIVSLLLAGVLLTDQSNANTVEGTITIAEDEPVPDASSVLNNPTSSTLTVIAYSNGEVVAETTTNDQGKYSFETTEESVDVVVNAKGIYTDEGEVYVAGRQEITTTTDTTTDFEFVNFEQHEVNSQPVFVSYQHTTADGVSENQIGNIVQAQTIDLYESYQVIDDIDASDTEDWRNGFNPIGITDETVNSYNLYDFFQGSINGNGHTISNLYVNRTDRAGFIAKNRGTVVNLHFDSADMTTQDSTGSTGVVASVNEGTIRNVSVQDSVAVGNEVGLIVGLNKGSVLIDAKGVIDQVYAEGEVNGNHYVLQLGGIAGKSTGYAEISNAQANVTLPEPVEDDPAIDIGGVVGLVTDEVGLITQNQYNEETAPDAVGSTYEFNGTISNNEGVPESELQNETLDPIATDA